MSSNLQYDVLEDEYVNCTWAMVLAVPYIKMLNIQYFEVVDKVSYFESGGDIDRDVHGVDVGHDVGGFDYDVALAVDNGDVDPDCDVDPGLTSLAVDPGADDSDVEDPDAYYLEGIHLSQVVVVVVVVGIACNEISPKNYGLCPNHISTIEIYQHAPQSMMLATTTCISTDHPSYFVRIYWFHFPIQRSIPLLYHLPYWRCRYFPWYLPLSFDSAPHWPFFSAFHPSYFEQKHILTLRIRNWNKLGDSV